jgi:hypothetical protein
MRVHMLFSPPQGMAITGEVTAIDMEMHRLSVKREGTTKPYTFRVRKCDQLQDVTNGDWVRIDSLDTKTADSISKI